MTENLDENLETLTGRLLYTRQLSATDDRRDANSETVAYEMRLVGQPPMLMTYPPSGPALGEVHIGEPAQTPHDDAPLSADMVLEALNQHVINWQALAAHADVRPHETGWEIEFSTDHDQPQRYAVLTVEAMPAAGLHIPSMPMHEWATGTIPFPYLLREACYSAEDKLAITDWHDSEDLDPTSMNDCREAVRQALADRQSDPRNSNFTTVDVERYVDDIAEYIFVEPPSASVDDDAIREALDEVAEAAWREIYTTAYDNEDEQQDAFITAVLSSSSELLAPLAEAGLLHKSGNPTRFIINECLDWFHSMLGFIERDRLRRT